MRGRKYNCNRKVIEQTRGVGVSALMGKLLLNWSRETEYMYKNKDRHISTFDNVENCSILLIALNLHPKRNKS